MFIEVADYSINTSYIAYVRYFHRELTLEHGCTITLQNGHEIEVTSYDEVQTVRESLRGAGMAIMSIDEPPDDYAGYID